ncbi:hypothetical protein JZ785_09105 [Alicyclobacillus curvatus]|nr:hypothetical protein JZ785_09105 [Alicyclobacillus curvatus]
MMNLDREKILDDFPELGYQLASQLEDWQHEGMLDKVGQLLVLMANATEGKSSDEVRAFADKFFRTVNFADGLLSIPEVSKFTQTLTRVAQASSVPVESGKPATRDLVEVMEQLQQPDVLAGLDLVIGVLRGIGRATVDRQ